VLNWHRMRALCRLAVRALVLPLIVGLTAAARAQESDDDPKIERRLGTRVELVAGGPSAAPSASALAGSGAALSPRPDGPRAADVVPPAVSVQPLAPPAAGSKVPHLQIGFRRWTFAEVGALATPGSGASEPFDVLSLDFYPVSSTWRFGLSTQYGWEEGRFRKNGDAFIVETVSLGGQIPGQRFTPFLEGFIGGGYMQRTHPQYQLNTVASAQAQFGFDIGTAIFLARYAFVSAAVGYLHAWNGYVQDNAFASVSGDTWSFKLGFGL
jgi:hypothetical protein